ncbi:MAG: hypothetical protein LBI69_01085 [Puniceicoccales bacterium]|jgi:tyrosine-specific transport protein|nr:hypothetical protein [Puniceicoccales bacterium]
MSGRCITFTGGFSRLRAAFLIAGTAIGAGELGLPMALSKAGYVPAFFGTLLVYLCMLASGMLTTKLFLNSHAEDLPSLFRSHLGKCWAGVFNCSYFALAFCLLVAYWSGLFSLLGGTKLALAVLGIFAGILFMGLGGKFLFVTQMNTLLTAALVAVFCALIVYGFTHGNQPIAGHQSWKHLPCGLPVILCSFGYHQVIPIVCKQLGSNKRVIFSTLILGTILPLLFALSVFTLGFHLFSPEELALAAKRGIPMFALLRDSAISKPLVCLGRCFSLLAIGTSLLGISLAMRGAINDLLRGKNRFRMKEMLVLLPFPIAMLNPGLFLFVLGLCGGIFGNLIAGIIPVMPFLLADRFRFRYLLLWGIFVGIFAIEVSQIVRAAIC